MIPKLLYLIVITTVHMVAVPSAGAADIVSCAHIIDCLGAPSDRTEATTQRTRGLSAPHERGIAVSPRQVVLHLLFLFDSTELADERSRAQLRELGRALSSPELNRISVSIQGHTCDLGSDAYNDRLSRDRACRIQSDLVNRFDIDPGRMHAEGYGERYPLVNNTSERNRRLNRRVVVTRIE